MSSKQPARERIAAIEARESAATPDPWEDWGDIGVATENTQANAAFIAGAREDIPWLLARLRRAEELLRDARQYIPPKRRIDLCMSTNAFLEGEE